MERDNEYLENRLDHLVSKYFKDVDFSNELYIKFGKRSKRQLGCIKRERSLFNSKPTFVVITSFFRNPIVPEIVIDATIAHELVHYSHGFNSPLPKIYNHPHRGNVVYKELAKRGFGDKYKESEKWLKENWAKVVYQKI